MLHPSYPSLFGRPAGVHAQSRALQTTIHDLRDLCVSLLENDGDTLPAARGALSNFSAQLSLYFDAEESSGYFHTIGMRSTSFHESVADHSATHELLRDSIASARHLARGLDDSSPTELGSHIARIIDEFERHELAENNLLQSFFLHESAADE